METERVFNRFLSTRLYVIGRLQMLNNLRVIRLGDGGTAF